MLAAQSTSYHQQNNHAHPRWMMQNSFGGDMANCQATLTMMEIPTHACTAVISEDNGASVFYFIDLIAN